MGVEKTLDLLLTFPLPQDGWEWAEMGDAIMGPGDGEIYDVYKEEK